MRILIAGAGTIGSNLAAALAGENLDVVILDPDEEHLAQLENTVDCQIVVGSAMSPSTLEDVGIRHTDLILAVTNQDAINMAICQLADFYGVPQKIARIRHPELAHAESTIPASQFAIDHIISPEGLTVEYIVNILQCPGAREAVNFEHGRIALRAITVTDECQTAGESLITMRQQLHGDYLVAAIRRGHKTIIPDGQEKLRVGDTVYVISAPEMVDALSQFFDPNAQAPKRVLIYGAGIAGTMLAKRLIDLHISVTMIEPNARMAERAAQDLDELGVEVLEGSVLDIDLLSRCHVETAQAFIALSDNDESNLMGALLYRKFGNGRPIVLTNKPDYIDILESVDLDTVINPRLLAVGHMLRYIRSGHVLSVAKLNANDAEVFELSTDNKSKVINIPMRELTLPTDSLIVAVMRKNDMHIPGGDFEIQATDRVLVFARSESVAKIAALF